MMDQFGIKLFWSDIQYVICPKILYTKVSDKISYANSVDPDQTAPEEAGLIRVYTVCHSAMKYF